jgi:hypothetical protein
MSLRPCSSSYPDRGLEAKKNRYNRRGLVKTNFGGLCVRGKSLIGSGEVLIASYKLKVLLGLKNKWVF